MQDKFLLGTGSHFKFIYFVRGGVGQVRDIYVFDRYGIPFKGCQGRSNRWSIVHAVSYYACGVIDTACIFNFFAYDFHFSNLFDNFIMHAVSMTPHAF
jgi:hypothetical protein